MKTTDTTEKLRACLARLFDARYKGTSSVSYAHAQGVADGYMQALGDLALFSDSDLLRIVSEERTRAADRADAVVVKVPAPRTAQHFA